MSEIASHSDSGQQGQGAVTMLCPDNLKHCQLASTDLSDNITNSVHHLKGRLHPPPRMDFSPEKYLSLNGPGGNDAEGIPKFDLSMNIVADKSFTKGERW